jgi:exonuclease III
MRIVTWNCGGAFRKKQEFLKGYYSPDIAIIQECENPEIGDYSIYPYHVWVGENRNRGLGVFSESPISCFHSSCSSKYHIFCEIGGVSFVAFWAMNDTNRKNRYVAQVWNVLSNSQDFLNRKPIVLGDFNWNIKFDISPRYPLTGNFSLVEDLLTSYGLRSVYHEINKLNFGSEKAPTLFLRKDVERPYHVDYIFSPIDLVAHTTSFEIGSSSTWIDKSDHMPLFWEFSI